MESKLQDGKGKDPIDSTCDAEDNHDGDSIVAKRPESSSNVKIANDEIVAFAAKDLLAAVAPAAIAAVQKRAAINIDAAKRQKRKRSVPLFDRSEICRRLARVEAVVLEESLSPYALRPRTFRELSLITAAKAERANKAAPAKKKATTCLLYTSPSPRDSR